MSVYKEGYHTVELIQKQSKQIWPDACDFGAPTKKDDDLWKWVKQASEWYGIKTCRKSDYTGHVSTIISLIDEWAVSDGRKTEEQATEYYHINYYKGKNIPGGYDGFFEVTLITDSQIKKQLAAAEEAQMAA